MNLRIAELDFDDIKSNLKTFLQGQAEFTDYDFEGSSLSVLLDILAYNTHYNAYLGNMLMNEMFLDSAVKRSSAVSIAKHLGYTPRSTRSAVADIDVTVTNPTGLPYSITLPRFTPFTTSINNSVFTFLNVDEYTAIRNGTSYTFSNVSIKEGALRSVQFVVGSGQEKFQIPDTNIDTTTLLVSVRNSSTNLTSEVYTLATDITGLLPTSKIYYLDQNPLDKYEIYFGDDVIGKKLTIGNIVTVQYIVSSGKAANVSNLISQSFQTTETIAGSTTTTVSVNSNSTGAADQETITEIKFNAPKINAAKNRTITASDYEALIKAEVTEAESVFVWGGEDNDPPYYGRVLISLKPYSGFTISESTKNYITNTLLSSRRNVAVLPVFIDPEYLYAKFNLNVIYNSNATTLTPASVEALVYEGLVTYFNVNLNTFNKIFYASQLTRYLMDLNPAIESIGFELGIQKRFEPVLNQENVYTSTGSLRFYNKLHPNQVQSTAFYTVVNNLETLVYLQDRADNNPPNYNGTGTLGMYSYTSGAFIRNVGTVNYGTGLVQITSLTPTGYTAGQTNIQLTANLQEEYYNISTTRNQVLELDTSTVDTASNRMNGVTISVSSVVR
jgi:hypothetical protein